MSGSCIKFLESGTTRFPYANDNMSKVAPTVSTSENDSHSGISLHERLNLGQDASVLSDIPTPLMDRFVLPQNSGSNFSATTKDFFSQALRLLKSLRNGKDNLNYLTTSLDSSSGGQRVKYTTPHMTCYRSTSLVPTSLQHMIDLLLTVPSSPLVPNVKEMGIDRHIFKRRQGVNIGKRCRDQLFAWQICLSYLAAAPFNPFAL